MGGGRGGGAGVGCTNNYKPGRSVCRPDRHFLQDETSRGCCTRCELRDVKPNAPSMKLVYARTHFTDPFKGSGVAKQIPSREWELLKRKNRPAVARGGNAILHARCVPAATVAVSKPHAAHLQAPRCEFISNISKRDGFFYEEVRTS